MILRRLVLAPFLAASACSFVILPSTNSRFGTSLFSADKWGGASNGAGGRVEQIEFKIYPDGRVEETVRGVKGNDCHKVTEKINEKLGEVIASEPTEEMFEQEVKVEQKLYQSDSDWDGNSSW